MLTEQTLVRGDNVVAREGLEIDAAFVDFVEQEVLPGLSVTATAFWAGLAELVRAMTPQNRALLAHRAVLQTQIDGWHRAHRGLPHDAAAYKRFLIDIGYLQPDGDPFTIDTPNVDAEIATIAGPQLVVPVTNSRFALNAANARWGSLFDALYGTDALGSLPAPGPYDAERGAQVVRWAKRFLNDHVALDGVSHCAIDGYRIVNGELVGNASDRAYPLVRPDAFVGFQGTEGRPTSVLLVHHGLHIELVLDRAHTIGSTDGAGLADVRVESAVTTIMDFEDSVSTVDAADKIVAYRNWLGLMKGTLAEPVRKNGEMFTRRLEPNRTFRAPGGNSFEQPARSLLLARNVGIHMLTAALRDGSGDEVFEGLLDAMMTITIALYDRLRPVADRNSRQQSIYIVKPKLHGPDEVAFAVATLAKVETLLGLPENTVKIGIMDEERRTTVNLHECIRQARSRVAFINTGFLDRTGDEIHTSMEAGPMVPKAQMRTRPWIGAYENRNVDVGLACGFTGRAQIGKGMWAAPDLMGDMLQQKAAHPMAGANCAWVPSPTAATLHAIHYHQVDVFDRQARLRARAQASVDDILKIPVATHAWSREECQRELDNNLQGILGYVVRWVDQGVGCSKVPDINNVALMEDRATCRISSQHVANWLRHGVISEQDVHHSLRRMAVVVDVQNAGDPLYRPMAPGFDGPAFNAASELVFDGCEQPSGYTEPILHHRRHQAKVHPAGTVNGHDGPHGVAR